MPDRTACVFHQFAIAKSELLELWRRWDYRMYPINPIDLLGSDDTTDGEAPVSQVVYPGDRWLVPGSSAYFDFFDAASQCVSTGLVIVCGVYVHPPIVCTDLVTLPQPGDRYHYLGRRQREGFSSVEEVGELSDSR